MNSDTTTTSIPLGALPSFFKDTQIVCSAREDFQAGQRKKALKALPSANENIQCNLIQVSSPVLRMDNNTRNIYQSNNFSKIKELEKKMDQDLKPIYDNIRINNENAWTKVQSQGQEFYMCWSNSGSMWAYTPTIEKSQDGTTFQACVQVGTYSQSSGLLSGHSYTFSISSLIEEAVISAIVAYALSKAIKYGVEFLISRFAADIATAAAKLGFQNFSCTILSKVVAGVACCIVTVIITIALHYLWEWLNRHYTICLRIYNWDPQNNWETSAKYLDNAVISGGAEGDTELFTIPKMIDAGSSVTPPGFAPVTTLDNICYYGAIIWENDKQFMQGCSMALSIKKSGSEEGFMWAFDCPRLADNRHAAKNGIEDPKNYLNNCQWNDSPKDFRITATSQNIPVTFGLNALSGAEDNLYNIQIQINK